MKKQLEIVVLIVWVVFLCILFAKFAPAVEVPISEACNPLVCMMSGGKCLDNKCVKPDGKVLPLNTQKPSGPNPTPGTIDGKCNPLLCLLQQGKCINNVCIPASGANSPMEAVPKSYPRH